MGSTSTNRLITTFILPVAGFGLLVCLACFFAWQMQLKLQQEEAYLQNLKSIEFSLLQLQESFAAQELAAVNGALHVSDYLLQEAVDGGNNAYPQTQVYLQRVQHTLAAVSVKTKEAAPDAGAIELELRGVDQLLQQSRELINQLGESVERINKVAQAGLYSSVAAFVFFLSFIVQLFRKQVCLPLREVEAKAKAITEGKDRQSESRFQSILFDKVYNDLCQHQGHLQQLAQLAEQIGDGNFGQKPEDFTKGGALGRSVGRMREKIQASFQDEEKRRWSNEGINEFSTLVRDYNHDLNLLFTSLINRLVPFCGANQGSIFLTEQQEHDQVLTLKASYAWGRQKYGKKEFQIGEGLIGQAALEKDTIFLTDVPDNFITIGSGLGGAKPTCVIILPLLAGEQLHGVLELASFKVFEDHQISFLQKLCDIIASAIAMAHGNLTTRELLRKAEEANQQLKAQEEELRQNTEELMATQEAMIRKEAELEEFQEGLELRLQEATQEMACKIREIEAEKAKNLAILEGCVDGVVSFNEAGNIEYFNKAAEEIWEISRNEAMEKKIQDFIPVEIMVVDGELLVYYAKNGSRKILDARTEVPVRGKSGQEMEVLLTLTRVKTEGAYTFTAFAQKVAVELF